jgi:hypothetical protein
VVDQLAQYLARQHPGLRGFTRRNLFRMRQFYEAYRYAKKVSPLVTQLSWTHHLLILGKAKRLEEREFYLRLAVRERWGKRELERQLEASLFERAVLNPPKVSAALTQLHPEAETIRLEPLTFARPHRRIPDRLAGQAASPAQTARILPACLAQKK